ncbi:hypothetical protein N9H19_00840 [Flavobacteriales bacterium]|nr:hypothetical protein [Flavobacteriales bacterium]
MVLLLNKSFVAQELQVAIGYREEDFNKFIEQSQIFDFRELVCEDFFNDLFENMTDDKFVLLIDGGSYTFENKTYHFKGLKSVLAYFTYARFLMHSPVVSTSHGVVIKETPHSSPLSLAERKNYYNHHRANGGKLFEQVKKYIERVGTFESWDCKTDCKNSASFNSTVIQ